MATRFRSEEEYQAALEARAREIWDEREQSMPVRVKQTWEQGTDLARRVALAMARVDLLKGKRE